MKRMLFGLFIVAGLSSAVRADWMSDAGLSGLTPMTDSGASLIRGKGFSTVYGYSWAAVRGAESSNGYSAVSRIRNSEASGANQSYAARGHYAVVSGGFSQAYAK